MNGDNNNTSFSEAFGGVTGRYYRKIKDSIVFNTIDDYVIGNIIIKKKIQVDWKLHNETKKIQDFVCYKATAVIEIINSVGVFKSNVVAWYCPKIPVSFGPKGYGDLPGLILELQEKNITFGAKKITLNSTNVLIEKPAKYKIVSEIEYEKMVDKSMQTTQD